MKQTVSVVFVVIFILVLSAAGRAEDAKCLYVGSYHPGNPWQDRLLQGLINGLEGKCELRQFHMDSKRNPSPDHCRQKALEAKAVIESWKPDVVIGSDDNASKYLIAEYYKDKGLPFVFCGVNISGKEYGYPYSNATGMIEVMPIVPLIDAIQKILPGADTGVVLIPDRISEKKSAQRYMEFFKKRGILSRIVVCDSLQSFQREYKKAQQADFIITLNVTVIPDWDEKKVKEFLDIHSTKLTAATGKWMTPIVMLVMAHLPEEQGEYAASVASRILGGASPSDIPVVANRRWNTFVNVPLLQRAGIRIPPGIMQQAIKVQ